MPTIFGPNTVTRWADMNGNSTTDLVYADSTAASRLRIIDIGELAGGSAHPNLLTVIDNGLGVQTEITYKSSTEYAQEAASRTACRGLPPCLFRSLSSQRSGPPPALILTMSPARTSM